NRVNFKGEIELGQDVSESILNEHLDEVLYFFENNRFDIVIIEDLDRFNNIEIFAKLREINSLLNSSEQVLNRVIVLYAVRDDIFKGIERTKFFDFVIPVIPVINPSNSNEKLYELLVNQVRDNKPSKEFIDEVSLFVGDMRLLNNICNEYVIYKEVLKKDLPQDNILAMIIYKNILPNDFVRLHYGTGYLNRIILNKVVYVKNLKSDIQLKISKIENEISQIEAIGLNSISELRAIYLNALHRMFPNSTS